MIAAVEFLRSVYIDRMDIWDACVMAFTANPRVLQHSPIVLLYSVQGSIYSRTLVRSQPKDGVWGIEPICSAPNCISQVGDTYSKTHKVTGMQTHTRVSWVCKRCSKTSDIFNKPDWIHEVTKRSHFFYYDFPFEEQVSAMVKERIWKKL
jgi:hypothetical protein